MFASHVYGSYTASKLRKNCNIPKICNILYFYTFAYTIWNLICTSQTLFTPYIIFCQLCRYSNDENCDTFHLTPSPRSSFARSLRKLLSASQSERRFKKSAYCTGERGNRTVCSSGFRSGMSQKFLVESAISKYPKSRIAWRYAMAVRFIDNPLSQSPRSLFRRKPASNYRPGRYITRIHYGIF